MLRYSTWAFGGPKQAASRFQRIFFSTWLEFAIRYRRTYLGPLWLVVGPGIFIIFIGILYAQINAQTAAVFVPHLAIGLIVWTLIAGFVTGSTTVFQRNRPQIMQGGLPLKDLVLVEVVTTVLQFIHQAPLVVAVFVIFGVNITFYGLVSLIGLALLIANGAWLTVTFGIIGARYRDLSEVVQSAMRIAFLATPIIWMPGEFGRGGVLGFYLTFNPFYHFLELVRAPLLDNSIAPLSWLVVLMITAAGFSLAGFIYAHLARRVPLWI